MCTRGGPGAQGSRTQGAPLTHSKHHFHLDPPSYKHLPTRNHDTQQHVRQHRRPQERARRQRAEAARRAEGPGNAPDAESTRAPPSTHPRSAIRVHSAGGDAFLPAFSHHTDAQAAAAADRRRVSGWPEGRRGGESAPRPHRRGRYTQVLACAAARSVCARCLTAGAGVGLWRRQQRLRRRRSGCGRHT
jgi:hypothetical protein